MNILQYDLKELSVEELQNVVGYINSMGIEVVAIPKELDLLIDCDTFTLEYFKEKIERAIEIKEQINEM